MKHFFITCLIACVITTSAAAQGVISSGKGGNDRSVMYIGPGMGLDYGGLVGAKFEFLPIKNVGLFAGAGYNLLSLGWNVGGSFKLLPNAVVTPTLSAMYGYNAVLVTIDASQYKATSYGVTFGGGIDWKIGRRGNKISFNLLVPIRSSDFNDKYDAAKDDPDVDFFMNLLPVAISAGFSFAIR